MRSDILKLQLSHTFSMRGATASPFSVITQVMGFKECHISVMTYIATLSIYKLERLLLTFTPTYYVKLRLYVFLNFWFVHTLEYLIDIIVHCRRGNCSPLT